MQQHLRVDADIYFVRIKKMRFQKYPDMCGLGLRVNETRIASLLSLPLSELVPIKRGPVRINFFLAVD